MFSQKNAIVVVNEETGKVSVYDEVTKADTKEFDDRYIIRLNKKYGLIDDKGNDITGLKYDKIKKRSFGGYFIVTVGGKNGLIDRTGKEIGSIKYDDVEFFNCERAKVKLNGKYGYITTDGVEIIKPVYEEASDVYNDGVAVVKLGGKYGVIDKDGNVILCFEYDDIDTDYRGVYTVKKGNRYAILDGKGRQICDFKYRYIRVLTLLNDSPFLAIVGSKGVYGIIDKEGKEVIPVECDSFHDIHKYFVIVEKEGMWGIMDSSGRTIVDFEWDHIRDFDRRGYAELIKYNK
ncbi:MAG: WG repeat-containing protein, partial [Clostridia bacterium]|nr:WG repeat-containing protein [Clostridia bacterium]